MRIIIDAMGGDNAPHSVILGVCAARAELDNNIKLTLVGDTDIIKKTAADENVSLDGIDICHTDVTISMEDMPLSVLKSKKESSMAVGMKLLKDDNGYGDKGDAFVSAGSTGALHAGSSIFIGRIDGIARSCIATLIPFEVPILLLDSGANPKVTEEYLLQWATIGSVYMNSILGVASPRIGLLNNGTEPKKGTELQIKAYELLSASSLNFVGNVESSMLPFGVCDVVVCDGFTGNIVLKMIEGMIKYMNKTVKELFGKSKRSGAAYMLVKDQVADIKSRLDSSGYGGAPLLGLKSTVIKAHGSSNDIAIKNAVLQAVRCVDNNITGMMATRLETIKTESSEQDR